VRVRWKENTATPLPPDEPAGRNPPDGAILDYYLPGPVAGPLTLEVRDRAGKLVRRFSSAAAPEAPDSGLNIPTDWVRPPTRLATTAGMHRVVWDLHYAPPPAQRFEYPIAAVWRDTPREPRGPWVLPGEYTVRLGAAGRAFAQPLVVRMDPRVHLAPGMLGVQFALAQRLIEAMRRDSAGLSAVRGLRGEIKTARERAGAGALADVLDSLATDAQTIESGAGEQAPGARGDESLTRLGGELAALYGIIEGVDTGPTAAARGAVGDLERALADRLARLRALAGRFRSVTHSLQ
jgi:hypothetical protein